MDATFPVRGTGVQQNAWLTCSSSTVRIGDQGVNQEGLRRAYERHWEALVRLTTLIAGDVAKAEDIVQEVFIRSRDRLDGLPDDEVFAYLRRGTINAWKNTLRHASIERRVLPGLHERATADPSDAVVERDRVWRAIDGLRPRYRAVLVLRYYEELPDPEIARLLGCTRSTVRTRAKRALAAIRTELER
jgi:RNA polymerase sigma factor (sigma-70 family)